ncbi:porin [Massilia sp. MS-15]|uniref:porin n=1 Tax=Massilia sp. MS-15 TaxID=2878200 RepID=UPI001CD4250D|nr:porin [Massilia sp. MS-15]MCA1248604.1 porin [Massilia sp. MS-15]
MKMKSLAIALLTVLPLAAHAQTSVQIYGIADASIGIEDTDAPGEDSRTVISSGTQATSRIGFRGTEDLGNGLKALFNIEAGYAIDTGAQDTAGLFQRRAVVGLQGSFGTVTIGREYSPVAAVAQSADPLGHAYYGSALTGFGTGRLTRRLSNSVNYRSNDLSGFAVLAAYSAGERQTNDPSGSLVGVAAEYKNGPLYLGAAYQQTERLATGDDKEYTIGAGYNFGAVDLRAVYMEADPTGGNNDFKYLSLGGSYTAGPNKFHLTGHQQRLENGARGNGISLAYSYALSKRTSVYTAYAHVRNNGSATFGLVSPGGSVVPPTTALGADPSVFNLGVRHSF